MKKKHNILYKILNEKSFDINFVDLTNLYLPVIGSKAFILFNFLLSNLKSCSINRQFNSVMSLISTLKIDIETFHECRKKLEAVELIDTYYEEQDENKYFLINLKQTKSFFDFIDNSKLKQLLLLNLSEERYYELEFYYDNFRIDNAVKLNSCLDEVFNLEEIKKEFEFNFGKLYVKLSSLTTSNIFISDDCKKNIDYYSKNYALSFNEIQRICINSIVSKNNKLILDEKILESELENTANLSVKPYIQKIVKINRNKEIFLSRKDSSELEIYFSQYNKIDSKQFLASIKKQQLSPIEINVINSLINDYNLSNPLINIIIDFSLFRTYGKLNSKYVKEVANSINGLNISDPKEALDYFLSLENKNNINENYIINNNKNKLCESSGIEIVELQFKD